VVDSVGGNDIVEYGVAMMKVAIDSANSSAGENDEV